MAITSLKTTTPATLLAILVITSLLISPVHAASTAFSDGKPWIMSGSDGHSGTVIFNSDGTGEISSGIMSMNLTWLQRASVTCIKVGPMAAQCFVLKKVQNGFNGTEKDGDRSMTLRRQ
jgi:hypothetical protein